MKSGKKVPLKPPPSGKPCSESGETIRTPFIGPPSSSSGIHDHFFGCEVFFLLTPCHFYLGGQIANAPEHSNSLRPHRGTIGKRRRDFLAGARESLQRMRSRY